MSTSIYAHAEVKINGKWEHHSKFKIRESYELFNKIAGIGNKNYSEDPIVKLKGLPGQLSELTSIYHNQLNEDAHSETWLNAREIKVLQEWLESKRYFGSSFVDITFGYLFGNYWKSFCESPNDIPKQIQDIRFIFWFDN